MPQISVRFDEVVLDELAKRGSELAPVVRHAVRCFLSILEEARQSITGQFTEPELQAIYMSCRQGRYDHFTARLLSQGVKETLRRLQPLDGVDNDALIEKLARLTLPQAYALVDVMEQFYATWLASVDRSRNQFGVPTPIFECGSKITELLG